MATRDIIDSKIPTRRVDIRQHDDAGAPAFGAEDPVESALDEALEETFPASDPIAVTSAAGRMASPRR